MSSRELNQEESVPDIDLRSTEVEFALLLSRIISSVGADPEKLRQTVYDLARYKLSAQIGHSGAIKEGQRAKEALETAIRGVENFTRDKGADRVALPPPMAPPPAPAGPNDGYRQYVRNEVEYPNEVGPPLLTVSPVSGATRRPPSIVRRTLGLVALIVVVASLIQYRDVVRRGADRLKSAGLLAIGSTPAVSLTVRQPPVIDTKPSPLLPVNFGVYGVSGDRLFELNLLPSRGQDSRVAISPTIGISNQPVLPDGRVKFIVYRREAAQNIPEHAEVRIVAKVSHSIAYDASGKQIEMADEAWYIRNISFPYRIAPVKENMEMFEVRPEDEGAPLNPGRYALVLKGQVYDFVVAGVVADVRHCLERISAANGTFVSECRKP
jgi:hypothetical protein